MDEIYEQAPGVTRRVLTTDEAIRFQTEQDVGDLIQHCADMREQVPHTHGRDLVPVAEIPMVVYERAVQEGWHNDPKAWRKWLSDPDNKVFRIWTGEHR